MRSEQLWSQSIEGRRAAAMASVRPANAECGKQRCKGSNKTSPRSRIRGSGRSCKSMAFSGRVVLLGDGNAKEQCVTVSGDAVLSWIKVSIRNGKMEAKYSKKPPLLLRWPEKY